MFRKTEFCHAHYQTVLLSENPYFPSHLFKSDSDLDAHTKQ